MMEKLLALLNEHYQAIRMIGALVVALWAFKKWSVSQHQKELELLHGLINEIRTSEVRDFISRCDYEEAWYSKQFHNGPDEKKVDYVLTVFSNLCYMLRYRFISKRLFAFFEYDLELLFSDSQVVDYLYNLFHDSNKRGMSFPYRHLLDYAFRKGLVKISRSDFEDRTYCKRSEKVHDYLGL